MDLTTEEQRLVSYPSFHIPSSSTSLLLLSVLYLSYLYPISMLSPPPPQCGRCHAIFLIRMGWKTVDGMLLTKKKNSGSVSSIRLQTMPISAAETFTPKQLRFRIVVLNVKRTNSVALVSLSTAFTSDKPLLMRPSKKWVHVRHTRRQKWPTQLVSITYSKSPSQSLVKWSLHIT